MYRKIGSYALSYTLIRFKLTNKTGHFLSAASTGHQPPMAKNGKVTPFKLSKYP
jgi:hypothetical protein